MKKIAILGALASLVVLVGCTSQTTASTDQNAAASSAQTTAAPAHHDYKGEKM